MNALVVPSSVSIRAATLADLPFIDGLQKRHARQLGYFPTKQFEEYIGRGEVLVAEEKAATERRSDEATEGWDPSPSDALTELAISPEPGAVEILRGAQDDSNAASPSPSSLRRSVASSLVGYCISRDRYLKRDELGVIYQLCVAPGRQRGLIGAALVKEVFARSAYGCRLYCCWCAQDLEANRFWEALGFVPVAFRAGSTGKRRVHIFWQRRINADDVETWYWYPFQTSSGAIREDRLVFPIPPGVHWRDVQPLRIGDCGLRIERQAAPRGLPNPKSAIRNPKSAAPPRPTPHAAPGARHSISAGGLWFAAPTAAGPEPEAKPTPKPKAPREKAKNDPKLAAAARELRDRWLERVNADPSLLAAAGKYEVGREGQGSLRIDAPRREVRLLSA